MIRKSSLSYYLLLALEKSIEIGTPIADFMASPGKFAMTGYRTNLNYSHFYKAISQLRQQGYIQTPKNEGKLILQITDSGKQQLILRKLLEDKVWDGKWRIVIFDIPEKYRSVRDTFRYQLKLWEFEPFQKSVWISQKDVARELRKFTEELKITDWVKIMVATEI